MKSPDKTIFETILAIAVLCALVLLPFAARAESHMPHQPPAFSDFDQDGDGMVSEEEFDAFRAARHAQMKGMHEGHAGTGHGKGHGKPCGGHRGEGTHAFPDVDTDGDGCISPAEFDAHHAEK